MTRVMVVDDDPEIRSLLQHVLGEDGLEVDCAENGEDALHLMRQHDYAVVLLDLLMPKMNGFEMLEVMRVEPQPVVLVITGAGHSTVEELDSRIVHGIVRKPFDPEELAELVRACVEVRERRGTFGAMALATMIAGGPFIALLSSRI